jgi:hypothetical protein
MTLNDTANEAGAGWPAGQLDRFGSADEIEISTRRSDGSLRAFVPIWIVAVDGNLYVRSFRGHGGAWYRHATQHLAGAIRAGGHQVQVTFTPVGEAQRKVVDAAYRAKYARYGDTYLLPMLAAQAAATTLRLTPQP